MPIGDQWDVRLESSQLNAGRDRPSELVLSFSGSPDAQWWELFMQLPRPDSVLDCVYVPGGIGKLTLATPLPVGEVEHLTAWATGVARTTNRSRRIADDTRDEWV